MARKFILFSFLIILSVCLLFSLCLKARLEELSRRFSSLVADKIGRELGQEVAIRGVKVGLFNHITVEGLRIFAPSKPRVEPKVECEKLILNYRLWDVISGRGWQPRLIELVAPTIRFKGIDEIGFLSFLGSFDGGANVLVSDGRIIWQSTDGNIFLEVAHIYGTIRSLGPSKLKVRFTSKEGGNLNLWGWVNPGDLSINMKGEVSDYRDDPQVALSITTKNRLLESEFNARGELRRPVLEGTFNLLDRFQIPFWADADLDHKVISLELVLKKEAKFLAEISSQNFEGSLKLNHFKFKDFDVVTELNLEGELIRKDGHATIVGKIKTQKSILDYKPFRELEGTYQIEDGNLKILSLGLGEDYRLSGMVELQKPFLADLTLIIDGPDMADLLIYSKDVKEDALSGRIKGEFRIIGPLTSPRVKGHIVVKDGNFGEIKYETMVVNLEGDREVIAIKDSWLYQKEGKLVIDGQIEPTKANIFEGVRIRSGDERIVWKGWDIAKPKDSSELKVGKTVGEDFRINFKTYLNDELSTRETQDNEVSLEYELGKSESIKMKLKGREEFLGLEHKLRF